MAEEKVKKVPMTKKHKRFILIIIAVVIIGAGAYIFLKPTNNTLSVGVMPIENTNIRKTINGSGIVESTNSENISAVASYKVDVLNVKKGDIVKEGDILCQLNPDDLNAQLEQLRASVGKAQSSANHSTNVAERGVEQTEKTSIETYEKKVESLESELQTADEQLEEAMMNYRLQAGIDKEEWIPMVPGEEDATLKSAKNRADQAERARDAVRKNLEEAREKLLQAQTGELSEIKSAEDSLKSSEIQGNLYSEYLQIKELEKKIQDTTIKAPKDGIVTLINVSEGEQITGLMFVIENLENYKIETNVSEYDINFITVGNDVEIKSEATGEQVYKGKISAVSPTANKTSSGGVAKTNIEFGVTVDVLEKNEDLKIGMNTRLTIVVSEKDDVPSVPFNAIRQNMEGKDVIYVVRTENPDDKTGVVTEIPVELGIESDLYVELLSGEFKDDDMVIVNPDMIYDGMVVAPIIGGDTGVGLSGEHGTRGMTMIANAG